MKEIILDFLSKPISFNTNKMFNIICENKNKYIEIMTTLENEFINTKRGFKIYNDGVLEKEETSFLYISNSFSLSLNSKKNLNALYKILKNRYYLEFKNDFIQINNKLEEIIKEISIDFDINLNANSEVKLDDLFKIASIEFSEDYTSYFEKLIKFIKISNELEKIDVVFIKNVHSYLNDDEIIRLINEFKYLNIMIINIEFAQYFIINDFEVKKTFVRYISIIKMYRNPTLI